jgi:hypothetical protein
MQFARPSAASTAIYGMCSRTYLLYVSQISRGIHPGQNTWPSACPLASSDSEEAIEKCAIAFKSLAEIFGIDVFATIPLLLQPFAFRCELLGITPHHVGHQAVCLLHRRAPHQQKRSAPSPTAPESFLARPGEKLVSLRRLIRKGGGLCVMRFVFRFVACAPDTIINAEAIKGDLVGRLPVRMQRSGLFLYVWFGHHSRRARSINQIRCTQPLVIK